MNSDNFDRLSLKDSSTGPKNLHCISETDSDNIANLLHEHEQSRDTILLNNLLDYFKERTDSLDDLISIVTEESNVSLRVLDWFVTNYAKKKQDKLMEASELKGKHIYNEYKSQLKAYNKKMFDPFSRVTLKSSLQKFPFYYDNDKHIMTTVGQLNFFRWAHESGVINYVNNHLKEIKNDIKHRDKHKKNKSETNELSTNSSSLKKKSATVGLPAKLPTKFTISFV